MFWAEFSASTLFSWFRVVSWYLELNCLDIVEAWKGWWGPGAKRNEDKGYVGVCELNLKVGNWGWYVNVWFLEVGELICAISWLPPSTTYDGYPIILQAWSEKVWKIQSSYFYLLTTEWYLEICCGGQETLGTSGGVLLSKNKFDQSRPNPGIVSQWEPVMYLNRRAPGSQPIKEQRPQSKEACVVAGQLCILGGIWKLASGNRLPSVCNRLQGLKMEIGC